MAEAVHIGLILAGQALELAQGLSLMGLMASRTQTASLTPAFTLTPSIRSLAALACLSLEP